MASLPPLQGLTLRAVATGADLADLPPDLLEALPGVVDARNPCEEVKKLCLLNHLWAGWCRSGWLYDVANSALGYYGAAGTLEGVVAVYEANGHAPPTTFQAYFQTACRAHFAYDPRNIPRWHPYYEARLLQQLKVRAFGFAVGPRLEVIPANLSNYGEIAKLCVQDFGYALQWVPDDRDDFGEIATLAVQHYPRALYYVPDDRDDFGAIARIAVQKDGTALKFVPRHRADFPELEALARH